MDPQMIANRLEIIRAGLWKIHSFCLLTILFPNAIIAESNDIRIAMYNVYGAIISCSSQRPATNAAELSSKKILQWCVSACAAHGFDQFTDGGEVSSLLPAPSLTVTEQILANSGVPIACLPFEPYPIGNDLAAAGCLRYNKKVVVHGMLVRYTDQSWTIEGPEPSCIDGNGPLSRKTPSFNSIKRLSVDLPESLRSRLRDMIGCQVVLSGELRFSQIADVDRLTLVAVELGEQTKACRKP